LEPIKDSFQGKTKVDKALSSLSKKVYDFLKEYDKDENKVIDINELENARKKLTDDLRKYWEKGEVEGDEGKKAILQEIVQATRKLEEEVIEYRKAFYR